MRWADRLVIAPRAMRRLSRAPRAVCPQLTRCRGCGESFKHLGRHLGTAAAASCRDKYYAVFDSDDDMCLDMEQATSTDTLYQQKLDDIVFDDLATFFFKDMLGAKQLEEIRKAVTRWNAFAMDNVEAELNTILQNEALEHRVVAMMRKKFSLFQTLKSEWMLTRYALTHLPVLRVIENVVGPLAEHKTYGVLIIDWIVELMINKKMVRKRIYSKSQKWKSGVMRKPLDFTSEIGDLDEGTVFQDHPFSLAMVDKPGDRAASACAYMPRIHMHIHASHPHAHTCLASACAYTPRIRMCYTPSPSPSALTLNPR